MADVVVQCDRPSTRRGKQNCCPGGASCSTYDRLKDNLSGGLNYRTGQGDRQFAGQPRGAWVVALTLSQAQSGLFFYAQYTLLQKRSWRHGYWMTGRSPHVHRRWCNRKITCFLDLVAAKKWQCVISEHSTVLFSYCRTSSLYRIHYSAMDCSVLCMKQTHPRASPQRKLQGERYLQVGPAVNALAIYTHIRYAYHLGTAASAYAPSSEHCYSDLTKKNLASTRRPYWAQAVYAAVATTLATQVKRQIGWMDSNVWQKFFPTLWRTSQMRILQREALFYRSVENSLSILVWLS